MVLRAVLWQTTLLFRLTMRLRSVTALLAAVLATPASADTVNPTPLSAATLRFRIEEPRDATVQVRVAASDGRFPPTSIDCAREGALQTCNIPAGSVDLRIGADGFVPHYIWGRDVASRARVDLGTLRLTRGASVSGRVTLPSKEPKLEGIAVELMPASSRTSTADAPHAALLTQRTKTNRRGFFQFAGVDEGMYTVVARANCWSPARADDVRVISGAEVAVTKPLALTPLATLEVSVDPPAGAGGKPWRIELTPYPAPATSIEPIRSAASPAGTWRRAQLEAGLYNLSVHDADGAVLRRQIVEVSDGMPPLRIGIESFRVRGRVTFRGQPLECGIWLTHPLNASASIRLRSDKDGQFETVLPEEGAWAVQLALAKNHAQLPEIEIHRRADGSPIDLELVVPRGRIRGKTVDETGAVIPSHVRIFRDGRFAGSVGAPDGTFEFVGIEPTDVMIHARNDAQDRDGGLVPHHVSEDEDNPVTITLPKRKKAKAWVVTPEGQPVAGALVRYFSAGNIKEEVTGPSGEFAFPIPESEPSVPMVILPPGLPRKMTTLTVGPEAAEIVVSTAGARLLLERTPRNYWIAHGGVVFHGAFLFEPSYGGRPREATGTGLLLELDPGPYAICDTMARQRCKELVLQAGTTTTVDVEGLFR